MSVQGSKEVEHAYDELAESWDARLSLNPHAWLLPLNRLLKVVEHGDSVLEIGCGVGREASLFSIFRQDIKYHGVDLSNKSLTIARRKHVKRTFSRMDTTGLHYNDEVFGGFLSIGVLQHLIVDECQMALHEIHRVTRSGAPGFIATAAGRGTSMIEPYGRQDLALPITFWEVGAMSRLLEQTGFGIEESAVSDGIVQFQVTRG